MAKKKKEIVSPAPLDVREAEKAFQQRLPELEHIARDDVQPVRVDLQIVSAIAYSVAIRDSKSTRRARLQAVGQSDVFDIAILDRLPLDALAAFHARRKQIDATQAASAARVPEPVLRDAQQIRARMLRVLTYYYEDDANYANRIGTIRAGSGYVDLANDLLALAEFYEEPEVKALLARDPCHYQESDPRDARQCAQQLFEGLGIANQGEAARWTDLAQRAWTLLARDYGTLRAAGQLVFRNDEDVEASYPSLVAAARVPASRSSTREPDPVPPPGTPVPPPSPAPSPPASPPAAPVPTTAGVAR